MIIVRQVGMRIVLAAGLTYCLAVLPAAEVAAASKFWKNSVGSGAWNIGNNWSAISALGSDNAGVPGAGDDVKINFNIAAPRTVTYDYPGPAVALHSLGVNNTSATAIPATLSIAANNLTIGELDVGWSGSGGSGGAGIVTQSGGVTTVNGAGLYVGVNATDVGTYNLSNLSGAASLVASSSEVVGSSGIGVFNHSGGTNSITGVGSLYLGSSTGSNGTYNLSGTGSLVANNPAYIGYNGSGTFHQTGGSHTVGSAPGQFALFLGYNSGSTGTYTLSGGNLSVNGSEAIGYNAAGNGAQKGGTFIQAGGDHYVAGDLFIGVSSTSAATGKFEQTGGTFRSNNSVYVGNGVSELTVDGPTTSFSMRLGMSVGDHGSGSLLISNGAMVSTELFPAYVGTLGSGSSGTATVRDPGSRWDIATKLYVGQSTGPASTVEIQNQGLVSVGDELVIGTTGAVNLVGGRLRFVSSNVQPSISKLNYVFGAIQLAGNRMIGGATGDTIVSALYGAVPVIPAGKELAVEQAATLNSNLTINGGTLTVGQLVNAPLLQFYSGTLNLTNQAVAVAVGGLLGNTLDLNEDMTVNVSLGITNQGLVTGDGEIGGTFTNTATGELRGDPGKSLKLTGANNTNAGHINLYGGMLEFTQNLTNNAGAFISGNGTLKAATGLTNNGTMNFAGTTNIVGHVTNAAGAKIISGGGGATIFYDDVTNNAEIRTSTNGFSVFFGSVSGGGTFTGTGTVNFEGDLSPGNSPAVVNFAGDVVLGADAKLKIELGGAAPGQFDQINVAGKLTMGGTLALSLTNGFTPSEGQQFDFMNAGSVTGAFAAVELPPLGVLSWDTSQLAAGVLVVELPGDYNHNHVVDAADYTVWRNSLGQSGAGLAADGNHDTHVDQSDFDVWKAHYGQSGPGGAGAGDVANVPEPAALGALFLALLAGCALRRGR